MPRCILHIDLDAFFVSVEQALNAKLRGKPVIVGGDPERRGVVSSASYEARPFGIHGGMPLSKARNLCPQAILIRANFTRYRDASAKFMKILDGFSPDIEPLGLDEAYLDVTGCEEPYGSPRKLALAIKERINEELSITASVGIGTCKVVAKIASALCKPDGIYDSWFIKRRTDDQFLRGFASWDQVDGARVRYFITGILPWLGQVDLSIAEGASEPTAFKTKSNANGQRSEETGKIHVSSQGVISIPRSAPRVVRYQVSRFCEWDEVKNDVYNYHLSTHSLGKAKEQGLKVEQLLSLLAKHTNGNVPPALIKALKRWEVIGIETRAERQIILRLSKPEILEEMRKSRAGKFLGEVLSPTAVIVKGGAIQKVMEALVELGYLAEDLTDQK